MYGSRFTGYLDKKLTAIAIKLFNSILELFRMKKMYWKKVSSCNTKFKTKDCNTRNLIEKNTFLTYLNLNLNSLDPITQFDQQFIINALNFPWNHPHWRRLVIFIHFFQLWFIKILLVKTELFISTNYAQMKGINTQSH